MLGWCSVIAAARNMCKTGEDEPDDGSQSSGDPIVGCSVPGRGHLTVLVELVGGPQSGLEGVTVQAGGDTKKTLALGQADFALEPGVHRVELALEGPLEARYDLPSKWIEIEVPEGETVCAVYLLWESTWIELRDAATDAPIAGARWRVTQASADPIEGILDDQGLARVRGLTSGEFSVAFPDLDKGLWDHVGEVARDLV
ncbi:MAG: hypothetical protein KDK70_02670 [Myxococcales bacterium]|nr:hypothetical protein [Myxococcales bacterium]